MPRKFLLAAGFGVLMSAQAANAVCLAPDPHAPGSYTSVAPRHMTLAEEFRDAQYVLTAKVVSEKHMAAAGGANDMDETRYGIAALRIYKGRPPRGLTVVSPNDSGSFPMDVGGKYLLFLRKNDHGYSADSCGYSDALPTAASSVAQLASIAKNR